MRVGTFSNELQVESKMASSFPSVPLEEPSSLMEFVLLDVRLIVHRDRVGVILGMGEIEGYDAALIVASGVAGLEWGARPWKGWHNWIVGEVTAQTFGAYDGERGPDVDAARAAAYPCRIGGSATWEVSANGSGAAEL